MLSTTIIKATLGLQKNCKKVFFSIAPLALLISFSYAPHLLPDQEAESELDSFLNKQKGKPFDFMKECLKYCYHDTLVLGVAVLTLEIQVLRNTNYEISFICSSSFTLAGLSAIIFRQCFMQPGSIGLIYLPNPQLFRFN